MKVGGVVGFPYGSLVMLGGLIGYTATGSVAAVVAEGATGGSILVNAWAASRGNVGGWHGVLVLAAFMAMYYAYRFWENGILVPTGLMAALSLAAVVVLVIFRPSRSTGVR